MQAKKINVNMNNKISELTKLEEKRQRERLTML